MSFNGGDRRSRRTRSPIFIRSRTTPRSVVFLAPGHRNRHQRRRRDQHAREGQKDHRPIPRQRRFWHGRPCRRAIEPISPRARSRASAASSRHSRGNRRFPRIRRAGDAAGDPAFAAGSARYGLHAVCRRMRGRADRPNLAGCGNPETQTDPQLHGRLPSLESAPTPYLPRQMVRRVFDKYASFDAGRGCAFQCSFCTIINVQGRKSRRRSPHDIEQLIKRHWAEGIRRFFHHRR